MSLPPLSKFTEIRHLPRHYVSELGNILQIGNSWRDVFALVPGSPWIPGEKLPEGIHFPRKYTSEEITFVADECSKDGRTGFEVLIEEWGTSGKIRPKVQDLINLFEKAGFERASLYLEKLVQESPCNYSSDSESFELSSVNKDLNCLTQYLHEELSVSGHIQECHNQTCNDQNDSSLSNSGASDVLMGLNDDIPVIPYCDIINAVNSGKKIGEGAFGVVYKAQIPQAEFLKTVAIKILSDPDDITKQHMKKEKLFRTEVEILSKCVHKNIIKLEGYSSNKGDLALIYTFMENGSLFDQLSRIDNSPPIPWRLRLNIAEGTAEGIVYLHTQFHPPLIHRDIKSPNILLDENFIPKLGDFGIVRFGGKGINTCTLVNTTPIGTQMYMAPEAFRGDVSVKMDTFSYAIVLLELLTGLPYFDETRENRDLLSHVQEFDGEELSLLESAAGEWDVPVADALFQLAQLCTKDKRERPDMVHALSRLKNILSLMN